MMIPSAIALLAPADVIDSSHFAWAFVHTMSQLYGFMTFEHAASSQIPQVTHLTHCLTLLVIPVCSIGWIIQQAINYEYLLKRRLLLGRAKISQHALLLFVGLPLFLGAAYVAMNTPGDPSFADGLTTRSRIGLAIMTFLLNYTVSLIVGFQVMNIRLFIDTHIRRKS